MTLVSNPDHGHHRKPHRKLEQSTKLQNVLYEIRGPVHAHAARLEAEGTGSSSSTSATPHRSVSTRRT